jgi:hypothetical protein
MAQWRNGGRNSGVVLFVEGLCGVIGIRGNLGQKKY